MTQTYTSAPRRWSFPYAGEDCDDLRKPPCKPVPPKPAAGDDCCPFCRQELTDPDLNTAILIRRARQLMASLVMLVTALVRCIRLGLATGLCLIGVFGRCCTAVGRRIAHPDDRRFLQRR